jgi:hypothetical protein
MIDRKAIRLVERKIKEEKGIPLLMVEHTNTYITPNALVSCGGCQTRAKYPLDLFQPIVTELVICPTCRREKLIAHTNLYLN